MTKVHRFLGFAACAVLAACGSRPAAAPTTVAAPSGIPPVTGERRAAGGVEYIDVVEGRGEAIRSGQCAYLHYTGWLESGRQFDASRDSTITPGLAPPLTVPLGTRTVIAGWDAGIPGMRVGGIRRLFVPYRLGYGEAGAPPNIPRRANLIFDVELVASGHATRANMKTTCPPWK
jgi:peptidylprolyl isomerase